MNILERVRSWISPGSVPHSLLHIAGDVGDGPVVILVHGIASSSVTFDNLVPLLAPHHRVISIDILGHGGSPAPEGAGYTVREHVEWLHRTIRSLRLKEPFTIVGHSLGALLVARYARENPSDISRVVLVSPPIYLTPTAISDRFERAAMEAYLKAYEYLRMNKTFTMRNAALIGMLLPIKNVLDLNEDNWDAFVKSLENCIESQTTISDIAAIRSPVDIVFGALDQFIIPGGMRIVEQFRNVTMHEVDASAHIVNNRLAKAVAETVK